MLDHYLQRDIVYRLAFADGLRFSELKPDTIDNKLFTYHLKKVVAAKFVTKADDGSYTLTPEGRRMGVRVLEKQQALLDHAESVLFLVIRRQSDGAWLLYERKTHPLMDRSGFMHTTPNATESILQTAKQSVMEKTGLDCTFEVIGSGMFRVFDGKNLESFTNFTLLACEDARGDLVENDQQARYYWVQNPDFSDKRMLPNMRVLADAYAGARSDGQNFFIEQTFHI